MSAQRLRKTGAILIAGLASGIHSIASAYTLQLHLVRDDNQRFHVETEATVAAPEQIVYETIRDFDHLTDFIPMLVVSRRTTWQGQPAVEQVGRARFLI